MVYLIESSRPIRGTVVELLRTHEYRTVPCVRTTELYLSTDEDILDIVEVLEEETGIDIISVTDTNQYWDTLRIDPITGDMVLEEVFELELV